VVPVARDGVAAEEPTLGSIEPAVVTCCAYDQHTLTAKITGGRN
jgi:hypothetical protein